MTYQAYLEHGATDDRCDLCDDGRLSDGAVCPECDGEGWVR